jgi:hypothetical protein
MVYRGGGGTTYRFRHGMVTTRSVGTESADPGWGTRMPDDDDTGMDAARAGMNSIGFHYVTRSQWPDAWEATVADAASAFDAAILGDKQKLLERINTNRLQLKFPRSVAALPSPIRACVEELEGRMRALCGDVAEGLVLQDCYALLTPADETDEEARSPQRWHLDAVTRFPVAALVLRGGRATEFVVGPYSDLAAGVAPATLARWIAPLKNIHALTWESDSLEEWMHFQHHLHAARLVTGATLDDEHGEPEECEECDWAKLPVAEAPPEAAEAGGYSIFWSNKVHRGPGTALGEERLVLFCSWRPASTVGASKQSAAAQSLRHVN